MKTEYILKAHVEADGTVKVDERVALPAGPIKVALRLGRKGKRLAKPSGDSRKAEGSKAGEAWKRIFKRVDAIKCPPPPADGLSVDELLYGPQNGYNNVY